MRQPLSRPPPHCFVLLFGASACSSSLHVVRQPLSRAPPLFCAAVQCFCLYFISLGIGKTVCDQRCPTASCSTHPELSNSSHPPSFVCNLFVCLSVWFVDVCYMQNPMLQCSLFICCLFSKKSHTTCLSHYILLWQRKLISIRSY